MSSHSDSSLAALRGALDSREFYEVMQIYRHSPFVPQEEVVAAFEAVKAFIVAALPVEPRPTEGEDESRTARMERLLGEALATQSLGLGARWAEEAAALLTSVVVEPRREGPQVIDLMAALKGSLRIERAAMALHDAHENERWGQASAERRQYYRQQVGVVLNALAAKEEK